MAKSKVARVVAYNGTTKVATIEKDEWTFTTVVSLRRDFVCGEYDFHPIGRRTPLGSFCTPLMHRRFVGLCRWFPKLKKGPYSKRQRVEVTLRILPDEPETPKD